MTRFLIASAFLISASAASATNPITMSSDDPPTARIATADVNIASAAGRVTVERRIQTAARRVCADAGTDRTLFQPMKPFSQCYDLALSSGRTQLEHLAGK